MSILDEIVKVKKKEVAELKLNVPQYVLEKLVQNLPPTRDFRTAISEKDCSIIAEIKKKSPSKGVLVKNFNPVRIASVYAENGAAAVSVLTDTPFFGGSKTYLSAIKKVVDLPLLRKDFIIDPYQIYEARFHGADAVLLIAAILNSLKLIKFIQLAEKLGIMPLVEVHDHAELKKALSCGAKTIGINNRDLRTFVTDINKSMELMAMMPKDRIIVSESGIADRKTIKKLMKTGIRSFLIGESLMTAADPAKKLRELLDS